MSFEDRWYTTVGSLVTKEVSERNCFPCMTMKTTKARFDSSECAQWAEHRCNTVKPKCLLVDITAMFHQEIRLREGIGNDRIHWNIARNLPGFCEILRCEQDYVEEGHDFLHKDREHVIVDEVERIETKLSKTDSLPCFWCPLEIYLHVETDIAHSTATLCRVLKPLQAFDILINGCLFWRNVLIYYLSIHASIFCSPWFLVNIIATDKNTNLTVWLTDGRCLANMTCPFPSLITGWILFST